MTEEMFEDENGEVGVDRYELEKTPPITKDFLGNEIKVGDEVVYMSVHYRNLKRGVIKKITPKMVQLLRDDLPDDGDKTYWDRQFHDQVVKI